MHDFTCRALAEGRGDDVIPLTRHRALAYSTNPYASAADVGLLVAYSRGRCAGYLGIMPGRLLKDGALYPVHWFSTWFVPPEFRSAGLGLRLLNRALALKYDFAVTGTSQAADIIYRGLGFSEVGPLIFRRLRLSLLARAKRPVYEAILRPHRNALRRIVAREVARLPDDAGPSAAGTKGAPRFYRGVPVINWMLAHPWVLEGGNSGVPEKSYAFSDTRDRFRHVALEFADALTGRWAGYLILSLSAEQSQTVLKVLDYHTASGDDLRYVLPLALSHASLREADQIDMPQELWDTGRPGFLPRLLFRKSARACFCRPRDERSPLGCALNALRLDYCDGDMAFV